MKAHVSILALVLVLTPFMAAQEDQSPASQDCWEAMIRGVSG